jgi:hypothetical protein
MKAIHVDKDFKSDKEVNHDPRGFGCIDGSSSGAGVLRVIFDELSSAGAPVERLFIYGVKGIADKTVKNAVRGQITALEFATSEDARLYGVLKDKGLSHVDIRFKMISPIRMELVFIYISAEIIGFEGVSAKKYLDSFRS